MIDFETFVVRLERIGDTFRERPGAWEWLGFEPYVEPADLRRLLRRGWWHAYWIGRSPAGQFDVGLRILPGAGWADWPVVLAFDRRRAVTFSERPTGAAALLIRDAAASSMDLFTSLAARRALLTEVAGPFYEALDGVADLEYLLAYLGDERNRPAAGSERSPEARRSFTLGLEASARHRTFLQTVAAMVADDRRVPGWPVRPLGAWRPVLANLLAARAAREPAVARSGEFVDTLWRSFVQPHGYDASDGHAAFWPDDVAEPYWGVERVAALLTGAEAPGRRTLAGHPLFQAAELLVRRGVDGYRGAPHVEAAAALDEGGDAEASWNALASAAYWSGRNMNESMPPARDAAIYLARRRGWHDALAALERQREEPERR